MALVPVRSKQPNPVTGEHLETVVDEDWLLRWPDDFDRIEPEPADEHVADEPEPEPAPVVTPEVGLVAEVAAEEPPTETPVEVADEKPEASKPSKRPAGTDPTQSAD